MNIGDVKDVKWTLMNIKDVKNVYEYLMIP